MGRWLGGCSHRNTKRLLRLLLLLNLLGKLELRHSSHGALALVSRKVDGWQLLLLWDHAHVDVLLVGSGNLLLLLLQELDLLLQSQLFHCRELTSLAKFAK